MQIYTDKPAPKVRQQKSIFYLQCLVFTYFYSILLRELISTADGLICLCVMRKIVAESELKIAWLNFGHKWIVDFLVDFTSDIGLLLSIYLRSDGMKSSKKFELLNLGQKFEFKIFSNSSFGPKLELDSK